MIKFTTFIALLFAVVAIITMATADKPVYSLVLIIAAALAALYNIILREEEHSIYR